jgi:hypothetical protein
MQHARPEPNLYAPPTSEIRAESPAGALQAHTFYVVSIPKFCVLYVATFGGYGLYWFYMHWQRYRHTSGRSETIWPVPRAVFSIFFTHALTERIARVLGPGRRDIHWSPRSLATSYVVLAIAGNILDRLAGSGIGSPTTDLMSIVVLAPTAWVLGEIQSAANHACSDPAGSGNARFTWANWIWIALGAALWALVIMGLFMPE